MRQLLALTLLAGGALFAADADETVRRASELERSGDVVLARETLARAAREKPGDADTLLAYAEFLDRYGDPSRKRLYENALKALGASGSADLRRRIERRLVLLALGADDLEAARRGLEAYRASGAADLELPILSADPAALAASTGRGRARIPGPFNSFRRMAALSTDQQPKDLVAALARNVVTSGYRASGGGDSLGQTEFLKLILRYLSQARELEDFAGADQTITISACESRDTARILKILGFRLRNDCGPEAVLETVNPSRAFLSIDSGFPIADLEQAFRSGQPFQLPYKPAYLPVVFGSEYWTGIASKKSQGDFLDTLLRDPILARLYVAMAKMHRPTARAMREKIPGERLLLFANVLDFFGGMFEIRDGAAVLPGGTGTKDVWRKLTGVSPDQGAEFFQKLCEKDDGWMASFYDSLARTSGAAARYYNEPARLERFYRAVRGKVTSPGPARPIFRSNSDLMLLATRLHFRSGGEVHIPGGIEGWRRLFTEHPHGQYDGKITQAASSWTKPDDVVEALFGLSRKMVENEPLRMFIAITNIDRHRAAPLGAAAVERLILAYPEYGQQFSLFNDAPALSDQHITAYLDLLPSFAKIKNQVRRADAVGVAQALLGLWRIFVRQGQIPSSETGASLNSLIGLVQDVQSHESIFDAGRAGVRALLAAAGSAADAPPQERLIHLLAGTPGPGEEPEHAEVIKLLNSRFATQRLVSLKDLFDLADHLERVSRGEGFNVAMANRLAARISEVRLPRSSLSSQESNSFARGNIVERHVRRQRSLNLNREVDRARGRSEKLLEIRGRLAPILRDSLVGLNYIYYSPPGAELIRANPLFVRSHDFLGSDGRKTWGRPRLVGTGWPNSGGGRLSGSLSGLAFALAYAEQNFLVPTERQALIWQDLAPQILIGATVPRWWNLGAADLHFVGLHMRLGETLLASAALNKDLAAIVNHLLRRQVEPARRERIERSLRQGKAESGINELTPSELYHLAVNFAREHSDQAGQWGSPFWKDIERLKASDAGRFRYERVASLFGTPHPELANSYRSDLLRLPLFPTMMGYSSRIMAESWESTNLYWAALADELHLPPAQLNLLVPRWTKRSIERIFATHLDDWPALLHSMRVVGENYRNQIRSSAPKPEHAGPERASRE